MQFSRQRMEMYYSVAVMILIPIIIMANTFFLTSIVRTDYDNQLGLEADAINSVLGISIRDRLDEPEELQSVIDEIMEANDEIIELSILLPVEDSQSLEFQVAATSVDDAVGQVVNDPRISFSIRDQRSVASLQETQNGDRTWGVVTPIVEKDVVVGISSINLGFDQVNSLVNKLLTRSLYALMLAVAIVLLLLLNHFKFVEYALLFRKLKEVDQMKSDFLSVATHELKSPMAVIKGSLENITDGVFGELNPRMNESLQLALMETDRLANLVTDLLNVSRIEQGRITYQSEPVTLQEVLLHLAKQYRPKAEAKGLTLNYEPSDQDFIITADRGRVLEIFTNLIDNAIKYSEKGEVTVFHKVENKMIKTTVRDTGIGMTSKERENLFTRFYRVQNQKTAQISGTGLGLWIIKQYIEAMNGHIYVDSLEGVGSEFTVEFPITAQKPATKTETQA